MMNNIEWKENAVCYADGKQWTFSGGNLPVGERLISIELMNGGVITSNLEWITSCGDFQLNDPKQGDYLPKSELDTEQKYNDAVEVFGLFGFDLGDGATHVYRDIETYGNLTICHDGVYATELTKKWCERKLTYNQLMAIGKLKRLMNERKDEESTIQDAFDAEPKPNKSKQAYEILKSLDYDYDLVKQCWYRKEYIK